MSISFNFVNLTSCTSSVRIPIFEKGNFLPSKMIVPVAPPQLEFIHPLKSKKDLP